MILQKYIILVYTNQTGIQIDVCRSVSVPVQGLHFKESTTGENYMNPVKTFK